MPPQKQSIRELFYSFPSLANAAESYVVDETTFETAEALIEWADFARVPLTEAGLLAAYFVATVVNKFEKLHRGAKFDFATAIAKWDEQHWAAFKGWVCNYLTNNSNVRPEFNLEDRKIEIDL